MPSIDARLTALADALQRRQLEQVAPVDGLSQSLFALRDELSALDDVGKAALLEAMNCPDDDETDSLHLTPEAIDQFISDFTK